jgi:hypothetical protein
MVTKSKSEKKQVKIGKLNKETVKDLTPKEAKKIKGGASMKPTAATGGGCQF